MSGLWRSVWIGFDKREAAAYGVAAHSARQRMSLPIPIQGIVLDEMRQGGLYTRPTEVKITGRRPGLHYRLFDTISGAPMSTEFAITRFLTPLLAKSGWALFMDSDVLVRGDLARLFEFAERDSSKALLCVQHEHAVPAEHEKMDGQLQQAYARKNWSSVMLFNCGHPSNRKLTLEMVNSAPGRDLHRFCWLKDEEIGALPPEWNWLVGVSPEIEEPKIVHFTEGFPLMPGYETQPYADEWRAALNSWAGGGVR